MIKTLFSSSTSACFEWQNDLPFYKDKEYVIFLNGEQVFEGKTNIFSLYCLKPGTEYTITSPDLYGEHKFTTKTETAAINVRDFGAKGDGVSDDTTAIQTAVNCLPRGARLYFPKGTYLTAPICLKSHITLEIPEGTTLLGTADRSKYPVIPGKILDMETGLGYGHR